MKTILLSLCLISQLAWADQADTRRLNDLIVKAVQVRDYDKARSLTVTQDQRDYVERSVEYGRQTKARGGAVYGASPAYQPPRCNFVLEVVYDTHNRPAGYKNVQHCY